MQVLSPRNGDSCFKSNHVSLHKLRGRAVSESKYCCTGCVQDVRRWTVRCECRRCELWRMRNWKVPRAVSSDCVPVQVLRGRIRLRCVGSKLSCLQSRKVPRPIECSISLVQDVRCRELRSRLTASVCCLHVTTVSGSGCGHRLLLQDLRSRKRV